MSRKRWIEFEGRTWRISHLAREYHIPVGTLSARLKRLPVEQALTTGIVSRETSGRRGKEASPWTKPLSTKP